MTTNSNEKRIQKSTRCDYLMFEVEIQLGLIPKHPMIRDN